MDEPERKHVLYVEVNDELWGLLNDRVALEQKKSSNRRVTRAEVVRDILGKGLRR